MEKNNVKEKNISNMPSCASYEVLEKLCSYMKSCVCKIKMSNEGQATGFFCIPFGLEETLKVLITNNYILTENDITPGKTIRFSTDDDKYFYEILIDESRLVYINHDYDISIIQLKEKDNLDKISFFEIDEQIFENNSRDKFRNKEIYLLHYPKGQKINYSSGFIKQIIEDKDEINHSCNTDIGSSGGPIINTKNFKVIGIHKGASNKGNYNIGTFLQKTLEDFKEKNNKGCMENKNSKREVNKENTYNKKDFEIYMTKHSDIIPKKHH